MSTYNLRGFTRDLFKDSDIQAIVEKTVEGIFVVKTIEGYGPEHLLVDHLWDIYSRTNSHNFRNVISAMGKHKKCVSERFVLNSNGGV